MDHYDIVIFGAGIIGLSVACGLQGLGLQVLIIKSDLIQTCLDTEIISPTTKHFSVLNPASQLLFQHFGIWSNILNINTSTFYRMDIWERDSSGYITFGEALKKNPSHPLGYVIENQKVHNLLWQHVRNLNNVTILISEKVTGVSFKNEKALLSFKENIIISTSLIIAADGAYSSLHQYVNIPLLSWNYKHHILIANVHTEIPHEETAYQVFHTNSILAFLPLRDPHLGAIIWSLSPKKAEYLAGTSKILFNEKLSVNFDVKLGVCHAEGARQVLPLQGCYAHKLIFNRLVLVGHSAHTMHPLLDQSLNLGLMDAAELIGEIRHLHRQGKDIGQYQNLRRYERRRKHNTFQTLLSTEVYYRTFMGDNLGKKILHDNLLTMVNKLPGIKSYLLKNTQGMINIPNWLR
ncbi:FAD-dependent monooxygenase [Candidatus Erwinia haradaeae]|uniref:2-octaprenylphenol hydroxylase n=1 Tax=Candidatus Erwinia haradaeae TaxID=1922217 RepID=A0A451DIQ1_9GAMM|nr:FAD-dependent monooxygenase [Candidatus Erwinia haradaeae]VFP86526.1 2-octaprenylphenol hydroxylase [Candidatus Erwinia haradaeae]